MNASTLAEIRQLLIQVQGAGMALDLDPNMPFTARWKGRFVSDRVAHVLDLLSLEAMNTPIVALSTSSAISDETARRLEEYVRLNPLNAIPLDVNEIVINDIRFSVIRCREPRDPNGALGATEQQ